MSCSSVMPMPPCICTPSLAACTNASEQRALASADSSGTSSGAVVDRARRREHGRARQLELDEEPRRAVLERLERADRHAELLALLQVVERELERAARRAEHLGRRARSWRGRARARAAARPRASGPSSVGCSTRTESRRTIAALRPSTRVWRSMCTPPASRVDQEERDAARIARRPRCARRRSARRRRGRRAPESSRR